MKKDEIDDRLMDALLRGEADGELVGEVEKGMSPKLRRWDWKRMGLAVAAMVLIGLVVMAVVGPKEEVIVATHDVLGEMERANELLELEAEIAAAEEVVEENRKLVETIERVTGRPYFEGSSRSQESSVFLRKNSEEFSSYEALATAQGEEKNSSGGVVSVRKSELGDQNNYGVDGGGEKELGKAIFP
ncbi:MAG: hypothetical protein AAGC74_10020 [Verrucomicrobiota bacterium]